ncbi:hypothetical protein SH2C18_35270 [Clostridium sediminicola]|uniref:hypothetical protein n=1 Tax=Clostridium sediminicola TaxID=3114879 RepID=UPI0031F1E0A5
MFYFVKDVEDNVMNVNCFSEVPFLEEALFNMSLEKIIKEYENIKKWFMLNEIVNNLQRKGAAGEELNFFLVDEIPYNDMDYTHDTLQKKIKQKIGSEFEKFEYDLRLRLSRTCSVILFEAKIKHVLNEMI